MIHAGFLILWICGGFRVRVTFNTDNLCTGKHVHVLCKGRALDSFVIIKVL